MRKFIIAALIAGSLMPMAAAAQDTTAQDLYSGHWFYNETVNQMTDKHETTAMLASRNLAVANNFAGTPVHAILGVFAPKKAVVIQGERSVFDCPRSCVMVVRFDDRQPATFWLDKVKADTVKVADPKKFMKAMAGASTMKLQLPFATVGTVVYEFDVSGFDTARVR